MPIPNYIWISLTHEIQRKYGIKSENYRLVLKQQIKKMLPKNTYLDKNNCYNQASLQLKWLYVTIWDVCVVWKLEQDKYNKHSLWNII